MLETIDPNSAKWFSKWGEELLKKREELPAELKVPPKWDFWEKVIKEPDKYIAKTITGDIFLKYKIGSFDSDTLYYFAMVDMLFVKDARPGWFKIFLIDSPEKPGGWKPVEFEFSWPSTFTFKQLE